MTIWAIADLHLAFSVPSKTMDVFGEAWKDYAEKIKRHWIQNVKPEDLVLIPGDISWAMHPEEAAIDLQWIHELPGTKVMIRGNHDYWWTSLSKVEKVLPASIHVIQNNVFEWKGIGIAGARLWDTNEYSFGEYIAFTPNKQTTKESRPVDETESEKIFQRELGRLENSLKCLKTEKRIAMTHYPPISVDLQDSQASRLLDKYGVQHCVFGHLHNFKPNRIAFGEKNGVTYTLTACDYIDFCPIKVL